MFIYIILGVLIWVLSASKVLDGINQRDKPLPIPVVILAMMFAPVVVLGYFGLLVAVGAGALIMGLGQGLREAVSRRREATTEPQVSP